MVGGGDGNGGSAWARTDHVEAVVAVDLLERVVLDVPGAPKDLYGKLVGLQAPLARPALHNFGQDGQELGSVPRIGLEGVATNALGLSTGAVVEGCRVQAEGSRALGIRLLQQKHALDVVVLDNLPSALLALLSVQQRLLQAALAEARGPESDLDAHGVHHAEHLAGRAV